MINSPWVRLLQLVLSGVLVAGISGGACAAKLYKWVDEKGQMHYSESIPPQYRDKPNTEIDKRGRVVRNNEALAEQKRQTEEEAARKQTEEKRLGEQARRDKALMDTYTSEAEIDLARDRNMSMPQQAMESYVPRIRTAKQRGDGLRAERDALVKSGKPVPPALASEIAASEKEVATLQAEQKAKQAEIDQIREKYNAQKARYRELMGTAGSASGTAKNP